MKEGNSNGFSDKSSFDVAKLLFNTFVRNKGMGRIPWVTGLAFTQSSNPPEEHQNQNDLQIHFVPLIPHDQTMAEKNFGVTLDDARPMRDLQQHPAYGVTILPSLILPSSKGTITLSSGDPAAHPTIEPAYLSDARDIERAVEISKLAGKIATSGPQVMSSISSSLTRASHTQQDRTRTLQSTSTGRR